MRIAICDDEQIHLDNIERHLSGYKYNIKYISEQFTSGEALISSYKNGKSFDIIFLDIKMKEMDGIDTAKEIRKMDKDVLIIFITNFMEYILQGYEVRAFQYLIKPVSQERFNKEFIRAVQEYTNKNDKLYVIRTKELLINLDLRSIVFLESYGRKIVLHTEDKAYEYYANISDEEEKLKEYGFIRVHKSFLVNLENIKMMNKIKIQTKNGVEIPVSEKRHKKVYDHFLEYLMRWAI